jgi:hypothetical protein
VGVLARSDRSANPRKFVTTSIGMGDERSLRTDADPKAGVGSEKDTGMEVTVDRQAGRPRLWVRRKGHPELLAVYTYVCLPDTVDPRGAKGK